MSLHLVKVGLKNGQVFEVRLPSEQLYRETFRLDPHLRVNAIVAAARLRGWQIDRDDVRSFTVFRPYDPPSAGPPIVGDLGPGVAVAHARARRTARCRTVLSLASRLLPSRVRETTLSEWLDHVETSAEEGLSVVRPTVSIVVRAVPRLVWQSRMPVRAGGKG